MSILDKLIKETNKIDFLFPNSFEQLMNSEYYDYDKFEWFLYYVFKMDGSNVQKVGAKGKGDGGADLIVSDKLPDGGVRRIGIQAKYWKNRVGTGPINQLASAKSRHGLTDLWIVTTSDLTTDAKEIAEAMDIKILRGEDVENLIEHIKRLYQKDIDEKGESSIEFLQEERKPVKKEKTKVSIKTEKTTDTELVKKLKELRSEISRKHKIYPIYMVYNNTNIDDLIAASPKTLDELSKVKGFGPAKLDLFGNDIIELFKANENKSSLDIPKEDEVLFNKLIAERPRIASFNKISEESVYSDQVARNLAKMKPKNLKHLERIYGFDKKNIEIFGDYLIKFISRNV